MIRGVVLAGILSIASPLSATIIHQLDTTSALQCTLSTLHHNRILVSGGRIRKVICPEIAVSIRMEEESGQVFVSALSGAPDSFTLSIITDQGVVQDLHISFLDSPSEVVVLTDPSLEKREVSTGSEGSLDHFLDLSNQIFSGQLPLGYRYLCVRPSRRPLPGGCTVHLIAKLEGREDYLLVYRIENSGRRCPLSVWESQLSCIGSQWVCLQANSIPPLGQVFGVVSVKKP